jgi:hypothetical protein
MEQLHPNWVVSRWLQLDRCNSLRQPLRCVVAIDRAIAMNKKAYCNQYLVARINIAMNKKAYCNQYLVARTNIAMNKKV